MRLGRIGFDQVKGFLKDGLNSLKDHPDLVSQTKRILRLLSTNWMKKP